MNFTKAVTKEPQQKLYLQYLSKEMENSSLEKQKSATWRKRKTFMRGLQVPGNCWMLRGCWGYSAQGQLCHWQSSSSSSWTQVGGRVEGAVAVVAPPLSAAAPSVSPGWAGASPGDTAFRGWGCLGSSGRGGTEGCQREENTMDSKSSPDQEHEHSHLINSHFINLGFHSCSCLPTRTCRDNVQSNEKEQICGKIGPHN